MYYGASPASMNASTPAAANPCTGQCGCPSSVDGVPVGCWRGRAGLSGCCCYGRALGEGTGFGRGGRGAVEGVGGEERDECEHGDHGSGGVQGEPTSADLRPVGRELGGVPGVGQSV